VDIELNEEYKRIGSCPNGRPSPTIKVGRKSIVYETFEECARVLLHDDKLDEAKGSLLTKNNSRFDYALHGQPEAEGEAFVGIYPPATPDVKWRVMYYGGQETEMAYREFASNPENGFLI
jgi:hypothetical protein